MFLTKLLDIMPPETALTPRDAHLQNQGQVVKLVTQFFPPDYAATGQLLDELVRQLGQLGMHIEVFTGQPGYAFGEASAPRKEQRERVLVKRSRFSQLWPKWIRGKALNGVIFVVRVSLHLLRHGWRRNQILLLTTAPPFLPFVGYLVHLLFRQPYICILYDLYPDIAIALEMVSETHPAVKVWRWLNRLVWQRATRLIVLSPSMKARIAAQCPGICDRIEVIHSWADPTLIVPMVKQDNWFAQAHSLVDPFVVLYSGNMGRCHDIDTIFAAAQHLKDEPIRFVCIGGGAKREQLIADVAASEMTNFLFLPYQDKKDISYSMTACDLSLISVSVGMESLVAPSKLYPALAAGRPVAVICPENTYLEPLVAAANCGRVFRNQDSQGLAEFIRNLAQDERQKAQLGENGRRYMMTHFTPIAIAQQYYQVLNR